MIWTDDDLITKDPSLPVFIKKKHIDELRHSDGGTIEENGKEKIQSKNLKEIDFDEVSVAHKIVEYIPTKYNNLNSFPYAHFTKDGVAKDILTSTDWEEADEIRVVSDIMVPTGQEQSITESLSTFVNVGHLMWVRGEIEGLQQKKTRQTLSELLGMARTEINCPFTGCGFTILPTEFYCSRTTAEDFPEEPEVEWYQKDGVWDIATWTNPVLHTPLKMKLLTAYPKGTTRVKPVVLRGMLAVIPEGKTREEALREGWSGDYPEDCYLFFANHYTRYKIISRVGGITFTPALKHDVEVDSYVTISNRKVHQDTHKDTSTVTISASNSLLIELDEFLGKYGLNTEYNRVAYDLWSSAQKIDKYFSPGILVKFQSHDKIYTIKSAEPNLVGGNYQIELNEQLEQDLEADEAVFLYTPIRAEHWEEVRTALDNLDPLPKENDWGFRDRLCTKNWALGNKELPPEENWVSGGTSKIVEVKWGVPSIEEYYEYDDPIMKCPNCGITAISSYNYQFYPIVAKISYSLDTLKGIPQYVYESDGNGGYVWREQIIGGEVNRYIGNMTVYVKRFNSAHYCGPCDYFWTEDPNYTLGTYGSLSHNQIVADGSKTASELIDYDPDYKKLLWVDNIKDAVSISDVIFKNAILEYLDSDEWTWEIISFANDAYLTDQWDFFTSEPILKATYDDFVEG